mgnify:CR=1 FL=1
MIVRKEWASAGSRRRCAGARARVGSAGLADGFTYELKQEPEEDGKGQWVIECTPKEDAPVVWGKVVVKVRADKIPVEVAYYDEDGNLARTMAFSDVRDFDGRRVPATMTLIPADKPEEFTRVTTVEADFEVEIDDRIFTLQALKE